VRGVPAHGWVALMDRSASPEIKPGPAAPRGRAFGVLLGLGIAVVAFVAGAVTAAQRGWGSPLVTVMVHNDSEVSLRAVKLRYGSCGETHAMVHDELAPGRSHVFRFPVCGEGGYSLEAVRSDGGTLTSGGYVERGHRIDEHVSAVRIRQSVRTFAY